MEDANDALIQRFYAAFAARDGETMAACYAPDATFSDPVFTDLRGEEPGAMWRMLTGRADDLEVELVDHGAAGTVGHARGSPGTRSRRPAARYATTCDPSSPSVMA